MIFLPHTTRLNQISIAVVVGCLALCSSCVEDEDGYSDVVTAIIDSIAYYDTAAIFFDKLCEEDENTIRYTGDEEVFLNVSYDRFYSDHEYWVRASFSGSPWNELLLTFRIRPIPGKYVIIGSEEILTENNQVDVFMIFNNFSCYSFPGDTVYVEQFSGGQNTYTWCDIPIQGPSGLSDCSGNLTPE